MADDVEYFRRRELDELHMARHARCAQARHAHRQLAGIYARRRAALAPALLDRHPASEWLSRLWAIAIGCDRPDPRGRPAPLRRPG